MPRPANSVATRRRDLAAPIRNTRAVAIGAAMLGLATTPAVALTANYYAGTDTAGMSVQIYTYVTPPGTEVYGFGMDGRRYCNGALVPNATLGGNLDGTVLYPVLDGRATFTQSRPDFFIAADMTFGANGQVSGTAVFQQAIYTRGHFPPNDGDSDSCTTTPLTFTASFVGSTPIDINPDGTPAPTTAR